MSLFAKMTRPLREANATVNRIFSEELDSVTAPHREGSTVSKPENKNEHKKVEADEKLINDLNK